MADLRSLLLSRGPSDGVSSCTVALLAPDMGGVPQPAIHLLSTSRRSRPPSKSAILGSTGIDQNTRNRTHVFDATFRKSKHGFLRLRFSTPSYLSTCTSDPGATTSTGEPWSSHPGAPAARRGREADFETQTDLKSGASNPGFERLCFVSESVRLSVFMRPGFERSKSKSKIPA